MIIFAVRGEINVKDEFSIIFLNFAWKVRLIQMVLVFYLRKKYLNMIRCF